MPLLSGGSRHLNARSGVRQATSSADLPSRVPQRVLDGIPGFLAWLALLVSLLLAFEAPYVILALASLIGLYSSLRFLLAGIANFIGLRRIRAWERQDWVAWWHQHSGPHALALDEIRHLVLIPNFDETHETLHATLANLARYPEAREQMHVVLAMEEAEEGSPAKAQKLCDAFADRFAAIHYSVHPQNLPGEIQCKSANLAWAARQAHQTLVEGGQLKLDTLVVTSMDADTMWDPRYFSALTCLFALHPQRHLRFWQAPIRYHANIWDISPPMRLINAYSTAFELAYLSAPWWLPLPMSSWSLSMRLLVESDYWDGDVIADEWHMFIKSWFAREGQVRLERIFLPFAAHATTGRTLRETVVNRYLQTLRHAWGSKEVGYIMAQMLARPDIRFGVAFQLLFRVAHDILLAGAGWILLTVGSQVTLLLHPDILRELLELNVRSPVFLALQTGFLLVSTLCIVLWAQDVSLRPPRPVDRPQTLKERALTIASFPLMLILALVFVALPTLQAQTRLMLGIPLQFRVTRKD
ncbi:MAG: glycosyltransferase [Anaerolineaceae bacterium]|nr:glycosyltransferase [Anaerolineaceae bacterium]